MTSAMNNMEGCVSDIRAWMCDNKLKLNDDKTEVLLITTPRLVKKTPFTSIHIGDLEIPSSMTARNLGCVFDHTMSMDYHINNICSSCFYHLKNISAIRSSLTRDATEKLIHAFISSRLDGCNALLYDLPSELLNKLQRVQNAAARILTRTPKYASISRTLQELHWLPIRQRIKFKILSITWKALHNDAPAYITELLQPYIPIRELRSTHHNNLVIPRCRRSFGNRAYSVAAPILWNALPCALKDLECHATFKTHLKTYLFKEAYNL